MKKTSSSYDKSTGISTYTIQFKDKFFTGTVHLHEDDKDVESKFAGCEFAKIKAEIKLYKYLYQEAKAEVDTIKELYSRIVGLKSFEEVKHDQVCQFIRKTLRVKGREASQYKREYRNRQKTYLDTVDARLNGARLIPSVLEKQAAIKKMGQALSENINNKDYTVN